MFTEQSYYQRNRETLLEKRRIYVAQNKDKIAASYKKWRDADKDRINAKAREKAAQEPGRNRIGHLQRKYNLTVEQYDAMFQAQHGRCAICGTDRPGGRKKTTQERFYVDHDYITGTVRGLLCHHCNCGLGHFKDGVDTLHAAVDYLRNPPALRATS